MHIHKALLDRNFLLLLRIPEISIMTVKFSFSTPFFRMNGKDYYIYDLCCPIPTPSYHNKLTPYLM